MATLIRSNTALAKILQVNRCTVQEWKKKGILDPAIVIDRPRYIIYNLEKVFNCLAGRRVMENTKVYPQQLALHSKS